MNNSSLINTWVRHTTYIMLKTEGFPSARSVSGLEQRSIIGSAQAYRQHHVSWWWVQMCLHSDRLQTTDFRLEELQKAPVLHHSGARGEKCALMWDNKTIISVDGENVVCVWVYKIFNQSGNTHCLSFCSEEMSLNRNHHFNSNFFWLFLLFTVDHQVLYVDFPWVIMCHECLGKWGQHRVQCPAREQHDTWHDWEPIH